MFKKINKFFVATLILSLILLTGCNQEETVTTCSLTNGDVWTESVFYAKGKDVIKEVVTIKMPANMEENTTDNLEFLNKLEGISVESSLEDDYAFVVITIDYNVVNITQLVEMQILSGDTMFNGRISLSAVVTEMRQAGADCQ